MIRFGKLTIEEFNNKYDGVDYSVKPSERQKRFNVETVDGEVFDLKTKSIRYQLFKRDIDNLVCVSCGIKASHFMIEAQVEDVKPHEEGNEVLMTKDHIIRKREGGKDHVDNMQVMCTFCNSEKN